STGCATRNHDFSNVDCEGPARVTSEMVMIPEASSGTVTEISSRACRQIRGLGTPPKVTTRASQTFRPLTITLQPGAAAWQSGIQTPARGSKTERDSIVGGASRSIVPSWSLSNQPQWSGV